MEKRPTSLLTPPSPATTMSISKAGRATLPSIPQIRARLAETASSLTLKRGEGAEDTILRTQIDKVESTGKSLMPEGLEKTISVQEMADLLDFLKNWRYLDGAVPATGR